MIVATATKNSHRMGFNVENDHIFQLNGIFYPYGQVVKRRRNNEFLWNNQFGDFGIINDDYSSFDLYITLIKW